METYGYCARAKLAVGGLILDLCFFCRIPNFSGEPRGFEPLTSAVQRRQHTLLEPSRVCKHFANKCISALTLFLVFQEFSSGCCTVAAHGPLPSGEANYLHIYLIPLRVVLPTALIRG